MTEYFRCLKSDFYKLRRCAFFPAHLLFSLCGAALMLIYAGISGSSDSNKLAAFAQIHAIAYPFVVSIVCQIAADQEMRAGHFQNLLTRTSRMKGILSKLTWLFLAGLAAVVISAMLFCSLFPFVTGTQTPAGFFLLFRWCFGPAIFSCTGCICFWQFDLAETWESAWELWAACSPP